MSTTQAVDKNERIIIIASLFLILYFGFLFLNTYVLKLEYTMISVLQEILTIPMMLLSLILLFFSIRNFVVKHFTIVSYAFLTILLLVSLIVVTWGSFFV